MSTLFLIGNGFDLNCGMKTRYFDVYKGYVKESSSSEIIKNFKERITSNIENWGDFEMAMARYAEELESEDELLECVRDFTAYMNAYLMEESNTFQKKLLNKGVCNAVIQEMQKSFSSFYSGISHNVDMLMDNRSAGSFYNMDAISFNYTDIFDTVLSKYIQYHRVGGRDIIHVHGVLQDDPVLGVDNMDQMKVPYSISRKGKRGFIKPFFNESFDQYRVKQAKKKIQSASTICTYGMSLGESDLSWRNEIVEWLRKDENHHLFVYKYILSNVKYRTVDEKMDIEDDEKEHLLAEWGIESDDAIFERIHIPCGKNIFNLQKVIENQIQYEAQKEKLEEKID